MDLAADEYTSCRVRSGFCEDIVTVPPRSVSKAARLDSSTVSCAGLDDLDDVFFFKDSVAASVSCDFNTPFACRGLETISEAARPNDPAVSKEADKTAVTGSHLLGSMMNGFGRNLSRSVSTSVLESLLE